MKKLYLALLFAFTLNLAAAQSPVQNTPRVQNALWTVTGLGCPAASGLPAALATQWTAALATVSGNAAETSLVQSQQSYVAARIAAYLAANPQQNIYVYVARPPLTSNVALTVAIYPAALPSGNSCPAS